MPFYLLVFVCSFVCVLFLVGWFGLGLGLGFEPGFLIHLELSD